MSGNAAQAISNSTEKKIQSDQLILQAYYQSNYSFGTVRSDDDKIKNALRRLKSRGLLQPCIQRNRKHKNPEPNIDLHNCWKGSAYYGLVVHISDLKNPKAEDIYVCHGLGNHIEENEFGEKLHVLRDIVLPALKTNMTDRIAINNTNKAAFKCITIQPPGTPTPKAITEYSDFRNLQKISSIKAIIETKTIEDIETILLHYYDNYYEYGKDQLTDTIIKSLIEHYLDKKEEGTVPASQADFYKLAIDTEKTAKAATKTAKREAYIKKEAAAIQGGGAAAAAAAAATTQGTPVITPGYDFSVYAAGNSSTSSWGEAEGKLACGPKVDISVYAAGNSSTSSWAKATNIAPSKIQAANPKQADYSLFASVKEEGQSYEENSPTCLSF